jgi:hypothetical protein
MQRTVVVNGRVSRSAIDIRFLGHSDRTDANFLIDCARPSDFSCLIFPTVVSMANAAPAQVRFSAFGLLLRCEIGNRPMSESGQLLLVVGR